jgi:hypothetical protein
MMKLATRNLSPKVLCKSKDLSLGLAVLKLQTRMLKKAKLLHGSLKKVKSLQKLLRLKKM